jgi:hypothetical protein
MDTVGIIGVGLLGSAITARLTMMPAPFLSPTATAAIPSACATAPAGFAVTIYAANWLMS